MKSHTDYSRWAWQWCRISSCLHRHGCKCHCKGKWLRSIPLSLFLLRALCSAFSPSQDPISPSERLYQTLKSVTDWQKRSSEKECEKQ
ncbi:hypothetical protein Baya_1890 [Bagarius yarrelli]|uniref:Uncharacterized protein n=1 Tax=Bagarius yarrelli TaxID=175774 RepID=A0A556TMF5_BAGYA|nr:hypothetical protein Baya_1890 [Bagarius yarrelli]